LQRDTGATYMSDTQPTLYVTNQRGNWIRLRTLIALRWGAIIGQLAALIAAKHLYGLNLEFGLCYLVVGVSVIANVVAMFIFPESKRLTEVQNLAMVMFDLLQLGLLLYLTGGLHNPFSILIVGPVTVAAAALTLRSSVLVGVTAILIVTLLSQYHLPLRTDQGFVLHIPVVFVFGTWAAISIATVFMGIYSRWIVTEMHAMSDALSATQMALSREQKLTDLGGVVAAAAHELGTPLATIKLTSAELIEDLDDFPEMQEDARLIRAQADRCRDILHSMGRAGKDDLHLRQAPLMAVIEEAAEPHQNRGKTVMITEGGTAPQPAILRRPEIIHGLRNLIQNAVDFARANVWIEATWDEGRVGIRIMDDGHGYPAHVLGRIGDPFIRRSTGLRDQRPGYEGMGLGLFIAKTLLERSGGELTFANGLDNSRDPKVPPRPSGAVVEVTWPRHVIDARDGANAVPLGPNERIEV